MPRLLYYHADEGDEEFLVIIDDNDEGDQEETGYELAADLEIVGDVSLLPTNRTLRPE